MPLKRLGIFYGHDQHKTILSNLDTFDQVTFGDDPWVMSDALIWFSTLWHFDPNGQNGYRSVEEILTQQDLTGNRIWLAVCFDFSDDAQWSRYTELIGQLALHPSLYAVGISTDEWVNYPSTEAECIEKFTQFRDLVRGFPKLAFCHSFFAWNGAQGPMTDGVNWFTQNYDAVILHNNYPRYDTPGVSNLEVLKAMLNRDYGPGCVGGSQGYFPSDWTTTDFEAVIKDFEKARDDHAQVLFLAMGEPQDEMIDRRILHPTMKDSGKWLIEIGGGNTLEITGRKEGCIVEGTTIEIPNIQTVHLEAELFWSENHWDVHVWSKYADGHPCPEVEIFANGVPRGDTGPTGILGFVPEEP